MEMTKTALKIMIDIDCRVGALGLVSPDIRAMTSHLLSPVLLTTVSKSGIPSLSDITRKY